MGTLLQEYGVPRTHDDGVFSLYPLTNEKFHPEIERVHLEFLKAGAEIVTINAFRTNPEAVEKLIGSKDVMADSRRLTRAAVDLANNAVNQYGQLKDGSRPLVAGNLTTINDCFKPECAPLVDEAYERHSRKVQFLVEDGGIDIILGETFNTIGEAVGCLRTANEFADKSAKRLEIWIGFVCKDGGKILDGTPVRNVLRALKRYRYDAVLFNCCHATFVECALESAQTEGLGGRRLGAYCNVEYEFKSDQGSVWERPSWLDSETFCFDAMKWLQYGVSIMGGCCGTRPSDISLLRQRLDHVNAQHLFC